MVVVGAGGILMCVIAWVLWQWESLYEGLDGQLTLEATITTAADDIHEYFFFVFQIK